MNNDLLTRYAQITGQEAVEQLLQLATPLKGAHIVHINSTRYGGGVAEILHSLIPLKEALGLDVTWEVLERYDGLWFTDESFVVTRMTESSA